MHWFYLVLAGLLEVAWAFGMKHTDGFTRLWPSVFTIVTMIFSFALLSVALRALPLGTGYAVWTGIGAVGSAIVGIVFLGESTNVFRLLSIFLIAAGIIGLKIAPGN